MLTSFASQEVVAAASARNCWGGVADKVARRCDAPVLIVPEVDAGWSPGQSMLVPLDGSRTAEHAIPLARRLAAFARSKVTLLRVWDVPLPGLMVWPVGDDPRFYRPPGYDSIRQKAIDYFENVAVTGEETVVRQGRPSEEIESLALKMNAGFITMTPSGQGRAARFVLGSTSARLLRASLRPILLLKPHE